MKFVTEISAFDPQTGQLCTWAGPDVEAESAEAAAEFCQQNGLGYCRIAGEWVDEIDVGPIW